MNTGAAFPRGRPVFVLAVILTAWIGGRAVLWEPEQLSMPMAQVPLAAAPQESSRDILPAPQPVRAKEPALADSPEGYSVMKPSRWAPQDLPGSNSLERIDAPYGADIGARQYSGQYSGGDALGHVMLLANGRRGASQLLNAGLREEEPPAARPRPAFIPRSAQLARADYEQHDRFSADAWGLWRDGMGNNVAPGTPSYGRSQMGMILRFALAQGSPHAPEVHLRATTALDGAREQDLALGLSGRPLPDVPVRVAIEGRLTDTTNRTELRGGAYVVSELPVVDLPAGLQGEAYLQAGYVTGEFDTAFIDGQARVTGAIAEANAFRLSAGGGVWGGAQEGTERLDVGPTASVSFPVGEGSARVSADYRIRVAGDAMPDSGPALTLATGF